MTRQARRRSSTAGTYPALARCHCDGRNRNKPWQFVSKAARCNARAAFELWVSSNMISCQAKRVNSGSSVDCALLQSGNRQRRLSGLETIGVFADVRVPYDRGGQIVMGI